VLIANSKRDDLNKLREMLNQPFKVKVANNGRNALKMVKGMEQRRPIDLIIMEPNKSGLDAAIKIQELELPEGMPLIYAYSRNPPAEE